ncbi:MAG: hypothetical protein ACI9Y1_003609 [Lentisphaeria bacterium]|jgi:hypothetical protein
MTKNGVYSCFDQYGFGALIGDFINFIVTIKNILLGVYLENLVYLLVFLNQKK